MLCPLCFPVYVFLVKIGIDSQNVSSTLVINCECFLPSSDSTPTTLQHARESVLYKVLRARAPTLPPFQVAEGFALPAVTALFRLRYTAPLLAAEHFRWLALRCGSELPATVGYVGTVSDNLTQLT